MGGAGAGGAWGGPWFSCCPANPAEMLSWTFLVSRSLTYPQRQQPWWSLVPRVAGVCVLNWCYAKVRHMLKNTTVRLFWGCRGFQAGSIIAGLFRLRKGRMNIWRAADMVQKPAGGVPHNPEQTPLRRP